MSDTSRRHFIRNTSVAAAAVGAATVIPVTAAQAAPAAEETGAQHEGHFTVWVRNARTGEIVVQAGENEVVHRDKALAAKLARIAATA